MSDNNEEPRVLLDQRLVEECQRLGREFKQRLVDHEARLALLPFREIIDTQPDPYLVMELPGFDGLPSMSMAYTPGLSTAFWCEVDRHPVLAQLMPVWIAHRNIKPGFIAGLSGLWLEAECLIRAAPWFLPTGRFRDMLVEEFERGGSGDRRYEAAC